MTDQVIPVQLEFTADGETARRAATAVLKVSVARPVTIVMLAFIFVCGVVSTLASIPDGDGFGLVLGVVFLVLPLAIVALSRAILLRSASKLFPAGARYATGFAADAIRVRTPLGDSTLQLGAFRRIRRVGDFVVLQQVTRVNSVLPGVLIPDDWFGYLSARLQGAKR
jgi:hypothetical protein